MAMATAALGYLVGYNTVEATCYNTSIESSNRSTPLYLSGTLPRFHPVATNRYGSTIVQPVVENRDIP
eukprot:scaffold50482_cov55-Attheya_sp.AAC.4